MDPKEQVATMLLENMQRCDLTVYEQAKGFQMMLDFGVSIADISEKTGFSQTTVRRRLKLLELDEDRFRESAKRNPTLMEYMELEQIEDISLRNEVLDHVGTPNFHCELQRALDRQKIDKRRAEIIAVLKRSLSRLKHQKHSSSIQTTGTSLPTIHSGMMKSRYRLTPARHVITSAYLLMAR